METIYIRIKDPKAKKLLQDLADMGLISIREVSDEGKTPRHFGCGKGEITIQPSFDEPLEEFKEYE